jgi:hypothetical protein
MARVIAANIPTPTFNDDMVMLGHVIMIHFLKESHQKHVEPLHLTTAFS